MTPHQQCVASARVVSMLWSFREGTNVLANVSQGRLPAGSPTCHES